MDDFTRESYNKKILGKTVYVNLYGGYYANVVFVEGDEITVKHNNFLRKISIFDIREPDGFE